MKTGRSITTRLIIMLSLCTAVVAGAGMLGDYLLSRQQVQGRLELEAREAISAVIIDMEHWLDSVESSTRLLARILQQRDYSRPGLEQMLRDIVANNGDIFGAAIALAPGGQDKSPGFAPYYYRDKGAIAYANLADLDYNYRKQAWYIDTVAAGRPLWVEPYYDEGGGEVPMTTFAVPVYRDNSAGERALYAVVTADVALAELDSHLQRLRLGQNGFGVLFSRSGRLLGGRNPDHVLQHYSTIVSDAMDLATWQGMFSAALGGEVQSHRLDCPWTSGQCVVRLGTLRATGWPVGVIFSEREISAPLRDFQLKTGLISLLTLLLMAAAVALVTRRLTRPLTALAGASDAIARGELDTPLPTARGNDEVATLIRSFARMQTDLKTFIARLESATASRSRLEGELGAARDIQMAMLPGGGEASEATVDYALWARVCPARSVGGDLYSYHCRDRLLFFAVGDVSDKGVPAALFMARAMSLIQLVAAGSSEPAAALATLNNALVSGNDNCMFVTLFLGVLDLDSRELRFASAGHAPPSLVRSGAVAPVAQEQGPALGLAPDQTYPVNLLQLHAGDRLAVFTDGVDEAFNDRDEMFGIGRSSRQLAAGRGEDLAGAGARLFRAISDFAGATPQSDDICLLLVELPAVAESLAVSPKQTARTFALGPALVTRVQDWLRQALSGLPPEQLRDQLLVAEEIVSNIDNYAGLPADATIDLAVWVDPAQIALAVTDSGTPFNPLEQANRSELGNQIRSSDIGGLGLHLITTLTSEQDYRRVDGRNILRVTTRLGRHPPGQESG